VHGVGVLLDVEVLLHDAAGIGEEGQCAPSPSRFSLVAEQVVGGDGDELRIPNLQLRSKATRFIACRRSFGQ